MRANVKSALALFYLVGNMFACAGFARLLMPRMANFYGCGEFWQAFGGAVTLALALVVSVAWPVTVPLCYIFLQEPQSS
jgi:uncharacterized membrane protein HdeD (DUF308 family)